MRVAVRPRPRGVGCGAGGSDGWTSSQTARWLAGAAVGVWGLPWTLFGPQQQREFLTIFAAALQTDGVFTAAAYSLGYWTPAARRFRRELERVFGEVLPTRTMWRHLPPAMTYVCRRPGMAEEDVAEEDVTGDPSR